MPATSHHDSSVFRSKPLPLRLNVGIPFCRKRFQSITLIVVLASFLKEVPGCPTPRNTPGGSLPRCGSSLGFKQPFTLVSLQTSVAHAGCRISGRILHCCEVQNVFQGRILLTYTAINSTVGFTPTIPVVGLPIYRARQAQDAQ